MTAYPKLKAVQAMVVLQETSQVSSLLPATVLLTVSGPSLRPGQRSEKQPGIARSRSEGNIIVIDYISIVFVCMFDTGEVRGGGVSSCGFCCSICEDCGSWVFRVFRDVSQEWIAELTLLFTTH